ncbi:hypothetical protein SAMN05421720_12615 [Rhodospira trueperi]|uniref:Uncharacterized protein n=1 Tax=Rhodospira trueperi TaxID=69960 RepID=A0A1G7HWB1_9PROT|nr:hypothetical protein SAMN05421720_12615 [Rhodospira trueperi]
MAGLALLVGCATAGSEPPPVCPPVPAYDAATLDAAADAVEALPPDSPLIPLLSDCAVLRAQSRACHGDGS